MIVSILVLVGILALNVGVVWLLLAWLLRGRSTPGPTGRTIVSLLVGTVLAIGESYLYFWSIVN